jgi:hypothetical protein
MIGGISTVIARSKATKQSSILVAAKLDCFAPLAMTKETVAPLLAMTVMEFRPA